MTLDSAAVRILISSALPFLMMLAGLAYFVVTDKYIHRLHKRVMMLALALILMMIAGDILDFFLTNYDSVPTLRLINSAFSYIAYPLLVVLFYFLVEVKKNTVMIWLPVGVNTAVYLITLFTPIAFTIDSNNTFVRGPLGLTCHFVCGIMLVNLFILTCREYKRQPEYIMIFLICLLLFAGATLLDTALPGSDKLVISFTLTAIVIFCVLFYIWIHLQLAAEYEERLMAQQRLRIMVSQIQPHFLYNTIATFKALCKRDPEKAAAVAEKFGRYLRDNLDSLSDEELIPVEKELDHTRVYAEIEMVRFENIRVEYDIEDGGYRLPALTIQPIVENAIRHGVRIRQEGIVRVSTRLSGEWHEIVIRDNGVGFSVTGAEAADSTHIGIRNVRGRIEKMCGGQVLIESEKDRGTTVTIRIPKTETKL